MPDCECLLSKELPGKVGSEERVAIDGFVCLTEGEFVQSFPDILFCSLADIDFITGDLGYKVIEPALSFLNTFFFYRQLGGETFFKGLTAGVLYTVGAKRVSGQADGGAKVHNSLVVNV